MIWVLEPQRRWQRENQSFESVRQRVRKRLEVQANEEISDGVRNERMQSWTSSGKSENWSSGMGGSPEVRSAIFVGDGDDDDDLGEENEMVVFLDC